MNSHLVLAITLLSILILPFSTTARIPNILEQSASSSRYTTSGTSSQQDLISLTCKSTPDKSLCETSLRSDPRSHGATQEGLILIMIDAVESGFVETLSYINELTKRVHDQRMIKPLNRCAKIYKIVLDYNIDVAQKAVKLGAPKFGEQAMIDSGIEAQSCEGEFGSGGVSSPISKRNKFLAGVSNVAAALVKIME